MISSCLALIAPLHVPAPWGRVEYFEHLGWNKWGRWVVSIPYRPCMIHSGNLTWQWNIPMFTGKYICTGSIVHCYVSLPEGIFTYICRYTNHTCMGMELEGVGEFLGFIPEVEVRGDVFCSVLLCFCPFLLGGDGIVCAV